jgi:hypothetical protein
MGLGHGHTGENINLGGSAEKWEGARCGEPGTSSPAHLGAPASYRRPRCAMRSVSVPSHGARPSARSEWPGDHRDVRPLEAVA